MDSSGAGGSEAIYREVQRFHQTWLWALIIIAAASACFAFVCELFNALSPDDEGGQLWLVSLVMLLVGIGLPALFLSTKLVVEVRGDGLHYRYHPFHRTTHAIAWKQVKTAEARTYRPILEYGGWGIRGAWRRSGGRAFNVYGNRGLQLELANGRRVLFGSQHADELASAVRRIMES